MGQHGQESPQGHSARVLRGGGGDDGGGGGGGVQDKARDEALKMAGGLPWSLSKTKLEVLRKSIPALCIPHISFYAPK